MAVRAGLLPNRYTDPQPIGRGGMGEIYCATDTMLGRAAPRPAYSILRSERPETPRLPHWRDGLRACLARLES